ncbi:uncharacterized protein LOC114828235 [Galendromus occidentalis]|uniref:Uncharacterized protein LOC114828235 n=1 Tax=Galendromus occidentalis TaxID=34638 RepID=A0AAJ7SEM3_9ACAR|nr:uncharacterized protein LOC114828235 [Galendromus occidentalis]
MPNPPAVPTVLLNSEDIRVETFRKFGIEHSSEQNLPKEALQVIECLARACLPIIGEHFRDAIRLHEAKQKLTEDQGKESRRGDPEETVSEVLETLHRKHKRLTAQKEVDRSVAVACQSSADLLNRGGQLLQKAAPLLTVPSVLSGHLQSLKRIKVPKLARAEGSLPSLTKMIEVTQSFDEVAKYSLLCFLQKRVVDYSDGERAISVLSNAVAELNNDIQRLRSTPRDTKLGSNIMNILAHVCGLKKLSSEVLRICLERENVSEQLGEDIARNCVRIITSKTAKLGEVRICGTVDTDQMLTTETLQENLVESIQRLSAEISSTEVIEDSIRASFEEICNSRELQATSSLLPIQRSLYPTVQPIPVVCPILKNPSTVLDDTLLDLDLEPRMEKLVIDSQENSSALEYLSSLEFGVDGSKIHAAPLIPVGNVDEVVHELTTFETLRSLSEFVSAQ